MSVNMGYCRFRNTLEALRECYESMDDGLTVGEHKARTRLINLCVLIAGDYETDADHLPHEEA